MKASHLQDDKIPLATSPGLTWPVVFSVAGITLLRSKSVVCQTIGASLTTLCLVKLIKKLATLV
ncbi:hypothetical protein C5471_00010 [Photorhabdus tasmaniensis]|uniref:Uncharacterized protein n=1 Tax=Photorhabdus tasmaniensis TaxID=1004159 RepID=A0ABX0GCK8_9GAMM|nr:hypothetical protein [Photorhabdus tasmaniensis]